MLATGLYVMGIMVDAHGLDTELPLCAQSVDRVYFDKRQILSKELIEQLANKPVDAEYFCKKLNLVIRDIRSYTAEELSLELTRLANTAYAQTQGQSNWISVDDKLPDIDQDVLLFNDYKFTGYYARNELFHSTEGNRCYGITHWMPLPAAPIESGVKG